LLIKDVFNAALGAQKQLIKDDIKATFKTHLVPKNCSSKMSSTQHLVPKNSSSKMTSRLLVVSQFSKSWGCPGCAAEQCGALQVHDTFMQ